MQNNIKADTRPKVSVIIPVHNGARHLKKTISLLQKQDYKYFEVILIENGSTDDSLNICQQLSLEYRDTSYYVSEIPGTSLARKKGIECCAGQYVLFMDQDDNYDSFDAISKMVQAVEMNDADIIQFGHYKKLGFTKKRICYKDHTLVFKRKDILDSQIKGVLGFGWDSRIVLNSTVWNKIYKAEILKSITDEIKWPLFFCEDACLNMLAFFSPLTKKVSVINEAYYCWQVGVGFSSSNDSSFALLKDFQYYKPSTQAHIKVCECSNRILNACYWDSLNVYRWTIYGYLYSKKEEDFILDRIREIESYAYIQEAKEELRSTPKQDVEYLHIPDFEFLTSIYTPEEYFRWCKDTLPKRKAKAQIKSLVKRIVSRS